MSGQTNKVWDEIIFPLRNFYGAAVEVWEWISTSQWRHNERDGASKSPASPLFAQLFVQAQIKENTKAQRHWLCEGYSAVTGEFPAQKTSNTENVSFDDVIMNYIPHFTGHLIYFPYWD